MIIFQLQKLPFAGLITARSPEIADRLSFTKTGRFAEKEDASCIVEKASLMAAKRRC